MKKAKILKSIEIVCSPNQSEINRRLFLAGVQPTPKIMGVHDLRKSVQLGIPAAIQIGRTPAVIVGEDEGGFWAHNGIDPQYVSDSSLADKWDGRATTIEESMDWLPQSDNILFAEERDTWGPELEGLKQRVKTQLNKLSSVDPSNMPAHPVVIVFLEAGEKERTENIRAMSAGPEIFIYDPSDPLTEIAHEIGHQYWASRVKPEKKMEFCKIYESLNKSCLPGVLQTRWSINDPEETFATCYQWWLRGEIVNPGYKRILQEQFPEAFAFIASVVDDAFQEIVVQQGFIKEEPKIDIWLQQSVYGDPTKLNGRMIKAKIRGRRPEFGLVDRRRCAVIHSEGGRDWVQVRDGRLAGRVLVLAGQGIDYDYMEKRGDRAELIPILKAFISKNGRAYKRRVDMSPAEITTVKITAPPKEPKISLYRQIMGRLFG